MSDYKFNTIWKLSILWGALFFFHTSVYSQSDSIENPGASSDTIIRIDYQNSYISESDNVPFKVYKIHHTRTAVIASAILPGLGQAYNRKFWKIPLIYGLGTLLYFSYDFNNSYYKRFEDAYLNYPEITDPDFQGATLEWLSVYKDQYRRYRDLTIIGFGLLYAANIIDAMVDSYMVEYDISKDLSLKVSPTLLQPNSALLAASPGLKMSLRF